MLDLVIFGAEGLAKDVYSLILENNDTNLRLLGFIDNNNYNRQLFRFPVKENINTFKQDCIYIVIAIGDPRGKKNVKLQLDTKHAKYQYINIIHKQTHINKISVIGTGNIIMGNVTLSGNVDIGNHVCIYSQSNISHDSIIGNYCTISPGVTICGNVKIGDTCFIGAGTIIKENINIVDNVFIGAGSLVLNDIEKEGVYYGSPIEFQRDIGIKKLI